ncbi:MAG: rhomboid family intramembrane serine protease [Bacteroidia bacterium]
MNISWGYSPKIEEYIPLGDLTIESYLSISEQIMVNLGWKLSHISNHELIAYTPMSLQSYGEEITCRFDGDFAIFRSECIGLQMLFNDYGKNAQNLTLFIREFSYAKVQVNEASAPSDGFIAKQDTVKLGESPLAAKANIKNVFSLLKPKENYLGTSILIYLNVFYFLVYGLFMALFYRYLVSTKLLDPQNLGYYVGANSRENVLNGEYWRLISHQFAHLSFFHLFFNMYALAYIGLLVEHKLGLSKFLITYLISGICGGIISLLFHNFGYMTGASGAIMGLFGAFIALLISRAFEPNASKALLASTIVVLVLMLLSGAVKKNVDNAAHLGGLISGFISGYILYHKKLLSPKLAYVTTISLTTLFAILVICLTPKIQTREFEDLQKRYQKNWVTYHSIFQLPRNMPTGKKLTIIQERGIDVWKNSESLVKEMLALNLNDEQRSKAEFHEKVVEIESKIVVLLYKECAESTNYYRREIRQLAGELNALRIRKR